MGCAAILENGELKIFGGRQAIAFDEARQKIHSEPDDCIVVAGTIIEGIGNSLSDFDVYVIGADRPNLTKIRSDEHHWVYAGHDNNSVTTDSSGKLFQIFDYIGPHNYAWDTEYWTFDEVVSLFEKVHSDHANLSRHGFRAATLDYKNAGFLHKILWGIRFQNGARFDELLARLNVAKLCYVLYRQFAGGYPYFRDVSGAWHAGNLDLAVFSIREHVYDQMMSLTFLEMQTNPNLKWLFDKVRALPHGSASVARQFFEFNDLAARDDGEKREFVLAGLDLLDAIFDRSRVLLDTKPEFLGAAAAKKIADDDWNKRANKHVEFERQMIYRLKMFERGHPSCRDLLGQHAVGRQG